MKWLQHALWPVGDITQSRPLQPITYAHWFLSGGDVVDPRNWDVSSSDIILEGFQVPRLLRSNLVSISRASTPDTCPTHLIIFNMITLKISGAQYTVQSSPLRIFILLLPLGSKHSPQNLLPSQTDCGPWQGATDQVPNPYKTRGTTTDWLHSAITEVGTRCSSLPETGCLCWEFSWFFSVPSDKY